MDVIVLDLFNWMDHDWWDPIKYLIHKLLAASCWRRTDGHDAKYKNIGTEPN